MMRLSASDIAMLLKFFKPFFSFIKNMRFIIVNYRLGGKRSYPSQVIVQPEEQNNNSDELLGKKIEYKDKYGNIYKGKIVRRHGRKAFIAIFNPNLPGYALGGRAILKE